MVKKECKDTSMTFFYMNRVKARYSTKNKNQLDDQIKKFTYFFIFFLKTVLNQTLLMHKL